MAYRRNPNLTPTDHENIAYRSRQAEGEWVDAGVRRTLIAAKEYVKTVGEGTHPAYTPVGTYEARYELGELDYDMYVRSV